MRAIQYRGVQDVAIVDVPRPTLTAGHALVRVTAAGICQTDVHVRAAKEPMIPPGVVLGHEIAGVVEEVGEGVDGVAVGEAVIVHPVWSCGHCAMCVAGQENACRNTGNRLYPAPTPGVSVDGGMAEYVLVPARALVPTPGLDPAFAAILADAGIVPYHSINAVRELLRPGSSAVVIGIGGLGQFAVELLRELTPARIIALDTRDVALDSVRASVDAALRSDSGDIVEQVRSVTGEYGAEVVLDLVGNDATMALAGQLVAPYGAIRVPGLSDGVFGFETSQTQTSLPWGASMTRPYSGTHQDLRDLVALAVAGRISARVTRYPFDRAIEALDDLEAGRINGRAVIDMSA